MALHPTVSLVVVLALLLAVVALELLKSSTFKFFNPYFLTNIFFIVFQGK